MTGSAFRNLRLLDAYRVPLHGERGDATCGMFVIRSNSTGQELRVIASAAEGWDHVSVSLANRIPTWSEMEQVRRLFWRDNAVVVQLHVPPAKHINRHPNVLHLWRRWGAEHPLPPEWMV